jgi:hypothetical protein
MPGIRRRRLSARKPRQASRRGTRDRLRRSRHATSATKELNLCQLPTRPERLRLSRADNRAEPAPEPVAVRSEFVEVGFAAALTAELLAIAFVPDETKLASTVGAALHLTPPGSTLW